MKGRNLRAGIAVLAIAVAGLIGTQSASAATKTTSYPTECSAMLCKFPLPTVWNQSVSFEGVTCILPGVTCPSVSGGRYAFDGKFVAGVTFSGLASVAATAVHSWITPTGVQFVYDGAGGSVPDSLSFTIDHAAKVQSLLELGGSATTSVFLDDLTAGTSLTVVNQRPITNQEHFATDPTVSVDPSQLTIGHKYSARVVTRVSFPVGVLPSTTIYYRNFVLTASAEDTDGDGVADNSDNCPGVSNPEQTDTDGDGQGDVCDPTPNGDTDNDGIDNASDNCPTTSNPSQIDTDGDGVGDACDSTPNGDTDGDGVDNNTDNCPSVSNADQADLDNDHIGDACDNDIDGDGVPNDSDPDPRDPNVPGPTPKGGSGGTQGAVAGNHVRIKVKCPVSATRKRCRVKAVGRFGRTGTKVTNTVKRKVQRGRRRVITLTIKPRFVDEANARGSVTVLRIVKSRSEFGKRKGKKRFLSRPVVL
jgi:hypothetical protein